MGRVGGAGGTQRRGTFGPRQLAGLELRHRQHGRVEDRICGAKATSLRDLPFHSFQANAGSLEIVMAATDLVAWTQLLGFTDTPELARCEIQTFRYRVLHVGPASPDKDTSVSTPPGAEPARYPPPGKPSATPYLTTTPHP